MASSFSTQGGSTTTPSNITQANVSETGATSGSAGGLGQELRGDAKNLADTATQRLQGEVDARKGGAVSQVQSLSSALGETAQKLGDDTPSWLRSALEQGAQTLEQFAKTVEQKDAQALGRDAQRLARENPGTFLAGCTLAGFLAARVFKAGASSASTGSGESSMNSGNGMGGVSGISSGMGSGTGQQSSASTDTSIYVPEAVS